MEAAASITRGSSWGVFVRTVVCHDLRYCSSLYSLQTGSFILPIIYGVSLYSINKFHFYLNQFLLLELQIQTTTAFLNPQFAWICHRHSPKWEKLVPTKPLKHFPDPPEISAMKTCSDAQLLNITEWYLTMWSKKTRFWPPLQLFQALTSRWRLP